VKRLLKITIVAVGLLFLYNCTKPPLTDRQIQARINFINGESAECMMDQFFMYGQNWQKLEGEHGIHGIDGLYIQENKGNIVKVLISESKWNSSRLGMTQKNTIKQMSKLWIYAKLKAAKPYNSDVKNFNQIVTLVNHDMYIARLFKLKPIKGDRLKIQLFDIKNSADERDIRKTKLREIIIDIKTPKNAFQKAMLDAYDGCRKTASEKWLPGLHEDITFQTSAESTQEKDKTQNGH